jgi:hypothetical protein
MNKKIYFSIIVLSLLIVFPKNLSDTSSEVITNIDTNDVTILVLLDFDFGANYLPILSQFEEFGWTVTTAAPAADYLFSEISDATIYDCINILPGSSHDNLMANQDSILNKIKTASDAGVIISAWCRAVRVLAAADVVDGLNITGHSDYASEYVAAGGDFYSNSPPIISGNLVTVSSTQVYFREMYIAMTQAIGCYENTPPVIGIVEVQSFANLSRLLTINIIDESVLTEVKAVLELISSEADPPPPATITLTLLGPDAENNYSVFFTETSQGEYSVDLEITDLFWNEYLFEDITTISVGSSAEASFGYLIPIISFPLIVSIILIIRRKKVNE